MKEKRDLDIDFYSKQIFPAVHIGEFRLAPKPAIEVEDTIVLPKVAIVMPVFNTQLSFLKESILSVLKH